MAKKTKEQNTRDVREYRRRVRALAKQGDPHAQELVAKWNAKTNAWLKKRRAKDPEEAQRKQREYANAFYRRKKEAQQAQQTDKS